MQHGTLKALSAWCPDAAHRSEAALRQDRHLGRRDINATVDTWIAGGLQFANGAAYSYVVLIGTG